MKILLVFPKIKYAPSHRKGEREVIQKVIGEALSLTLPQVAASTPSYHSVSIIDENYDKLKITKDYDLVGITCLTTSAPRAYEIADAFRKIDVPVILGGNHPTALPEEAKQHANSVVVGEAENTWPQLLQDFESGQLKPFYVSEKNISSESIPEPRRDLIHRKYSMDGLLVRRGCPNRCEFCTVTSLYNQSVRSIDNIMREIRRIPTKSIFIYDQNLTWDMKYTEELLNKLKQAKKKWCANGTIDMLAKNDEFLQLAKEANIYYWYIGFESISQQSLNGVHKTHNRVDTYEAAIKRIKQHGMVISGSFMFGFDHDTSDIFDATFQKLINWDIDVAEFHIVTPYPGTALYERLQKEQRILSKNWSKYNTANVVFKPKLMSEQDLFNGTRKIAQRFYSYRNIIKRSLKSLQNSQDFSIFFAVLLRNLCYRQRYKNQFDF
jgi:radical SAM superfamily enzyme YgiQ (UPF0313 family)